MTDVDLLREIDAERNMMVAVATGGPRISYSKGAMDFNGQAPASITKRRLNLHTDRAARLLGRRNARKLLGRAST